MASRKLVFNGVGDVDEFFFPYEMVEMMGNGEAERAGKLVAYLKGEAFKFFRENFTTSAGYSEEAMVFQVVKRKMCEKFGGKLTFAEGDEVLMDQEQGNRTAQVRRRTVFLHARGAQVGTPGRIQGKNKALGEGKDTKRKYVLQELGGRVEQYDLMNSLAKAQAGITFGQIACGDADDVRRDLQKMFQRVRKKKEVNVMEEGNEEFDPPYKHQVAKLTVYSDPEYALLYSGAIPNVMYMRLVENLKLIPTSTTKHIIVADGSSNWCEGTVVDVPVGFGSIVTRLKFMVLKAVPYDVIIVQPTIKRLECKMDLYTLTVKLKHDGKSKTLNLEYEPDVGDNTAESDCEEDIGEDSETGDFNGIVLMVNNKGIGGTPATKKSWWKGSCHTSMNDTHRS